MKTQCPHCQTKFNAPNEHKGKKAKCPKCGQSFVITPFAEDIPDEVCSNCGRTISGREQACIFNGEVVCAGCDEELRQAANDSTDKEVGSGSELAESEEGGGWLGWSDASKTGIVVGVVMLTIGIIATLSDTTHKPIKTTGGTVFLDEESMAMFDLMGGVMTWGIASMCLIVRSFRPRLGLGRAIFTFIGGAILGVTIVGSVMNLSVLGSLASQSPGGNTAAVGLGLVFSSLIAIAVSIGLLIFGFRPTKQKPSKQKQQINRDGGASVRDAHNGKKDDWIPACAGTRERHGMTEREVLK